MLKYSVDLRAGAVAAVYGRRKAEAGRDFDGDAAPRGELFKRDEGVPFPMTTLTERRYRKYMKENDGHRPPLQ
ncbi:MAG: hypothetical protein U0V70_04060 [Terriglobia bacterium]